MVIEKTNGTLPIEMLEIAVLLVSQKYNTTILTELPDLIEREFSCKCSVDDIMKLCYTSIEEEDRRLVAKNLGIDY
tara:strand:- start:1263 stop:1490 length:228 start_codon:yes stop_codon:yes gene_type:complete